MTLDNIALLLMKQGDYVTAGPLYREALEMQRQLPGDQHPCVAMILKSLRTLLHDAGGSA